MLLQLATNWKCGRRKSAAIVRARTACYALLTLWYVVVTSGIPLPGAVVANGGYPCAGKGCGCASAEQCWNNCCCTTPSERLTWAREHGVKPPNASRLEVAAAEPAVVRLERERDNTSLGSCCASRMQPIVTQSCCAERGGDGHDDAVAKTMSTADVQPTPDSKPTRQWFTALERLRCRGLGSSFLALSEPLAPPPPRVAWIPENPRVYDIEFTQLALCIPAYRPPTPPG